MPFIEELLNYGSLSIVGLEKNTGKTECLNYILNRLPLDKIRVGVSSIGIDGEKTDQVTGTSKPEIVLKEGVYFTTTEKYYKKRKLLSEILYISEEQTSTGRLITGRVRSKGKIMLSGPVSTNSLIKWVYFLKNEHHVNLTIIDGALSRLSPASPAVSEAMILTTGAALSLNKETLVKKTKFIVQLVNLKKPSFELPGELSEKTKGVWGVDIQNNKYLLLYDSAFITNNSETADNGDYSVFYVSGALTDRLLNLLSGTCYSRSPEIIVKDFTRIFISDLNYQKFKRRGGSISVLSKSKLIAICVNPVSPQGYSLYSDEICNMLSEQVNVPVYDILKNN